MLNDLIPLVSRLRKLYYIIDSINYKLNKW